MKVQYIGKSFGVDSLTNGKIYEVLKIDWSLGALCVVDDSGEDYLYSCSNPKPIAVPSHPGGHWEIVEDNAKEELKSALSGESLFDDYI